MSKNSILFYKIGCYVIFVFALFHLVGHFSDVSNLFPDDEGKTFFHSLQNYEIHVMGLNRTVEDFLTGHSWYLFTFMLFFGIQNLVILKNNQNRQGFIKTITIFNLGMFGILSGLTLKYFIYPPFILFVIIWICFLISLLSSKEIEK